MVSRAFSRDGTSPSVLQGIKTMLGFSDYELSDRAIHPKSASKAAKKMKSTHVPRLPSSFPGRGSGATGKGSRSSGSSKQGQQGNSSENLAARIYPGDCQVYDATDRVLLLTTSKYPRLLVKMQQNVRERHVADEMANEAEIYAALEDNEAV